MPELINKYFKPPFAQDEYCPSRILDSNNNHIADVRGWGMLTGQGAGGLSLSYDEAEAVQGEIAQVICNTLNQL